MPSAVQTEHETLPDPSSLVQIALSLLLHQMNGRKKVKKELQRFIFFYYSLAVGQILINEDLCYCKISPGYLFPEPFGKKNPA